jgi:hypothetical protein
MLQDTGCMMQDRNGSDSGYLVPLPPGPSAVQQYGITTMIQSLDAGDAPGWTVGKDLSLICFRSLRTAHPGPPADRRPRAATASETATPSLPTAPARPD